MKDIRSAVAATGEAISIDPTLDALEKLLRERKNA